MSDLNPISEPFRNVQKHSESFGTVPNDAESFRTIPNLSERKESHTLTVREVARMFEAAGVARTERSITNWCHPNRLGVSRLDSYFDPNEGRFLVTPQSVELAIKEEQAKAAQGSAGSEPFGTVPKRAEGQTEAKEPPTDREQENVTTLHRELFDLKITNRAKDMHIEQLHKERENFVEKLISTSRRVGELESRLLQLESSSHRMSVERDLDSPSSGPPDPGSI